MGGGAVHGNPNFNTNYWYTKGQDDARAPQYNCESGCSNNGVCLTTVGYCMCNMGKQGNNCELDNNSFIVAGGQPATHRSNSGGSSSYRLAKILVVGHGLMLFLAFVLFFN